MNSWTNRLPTDFRPLYPDPHVLTILGNYWPRSYDFSPFRRQSRLIETEPGVKVLVETEEPVIQARAEIVLLHGLEGSGKAGYIVSLAHRALTSGFRVHRFHMRTCGGTEHLCDTLYHAGLTSDLLAFLQTLATNLPTFLVGFSLGGNVALKAAAEAHNSLAGVCGISPAIDLARCAQALHRKENALYEWRFVERMKSRLLRTGRYSSKELSACRTIYQIDERITAPGFGFGTADHYYETQSALRYLPELSIPALLIAAQDDTLIPFETLLDPRVQHHPSIQLLAPAHGGHLGFLSKQPPRWWADERIIDWIEEQLYSSTPREEGDRPNHKEYKEQDLRDTRCGSRDPGESEYGRDQRNYEKDQ